MSLNTFSDLTVATPVVQSQAATTPTQLIRLGEAMALLAALYTGPWSNITSYTAGQMAVDGGSLYVAKVNNTNLQPSANPTQWGLAASGGASAYVYIAYASDASGTGFTNTFDASKGYIAVKATTTPISSPVAGDFTGLWKAYAGAAGANGNDGAAGSNGTNGAAAFMYVGYASDAAGTGFSMTANSALGYVAFLASTTVIVSPNAGNFSGLWLPYKGTNGTNGSNGSNGSNGTNGTNGTNQYLYLAYASDASGGGFSLTAGPGLIYIAVKQSATVIASPQASDFTGLWILTQGPAGPAGPAGTVTTFTAGDFRVDAVLGAFWKNARTNLFHKVGVADTGVGTPVQFTVEQTGVA